MKSVKLNLVALLMFMTTGLMAQMVTVSQGEIARWGDGNANLCMFLGKSYKAVGGYCYYPIDMDLRPAYYDVAMANGGDYQFGTLNVVKTECELESIDFPLDNYVTLSDDDKQRHWTEQWQVKAVFKRKVSDPMFTLPLQEPANPLPNGDNFGVCREFNGIKKHRHTGVDYAIGLDNPVTAVADGVVALADEHFFSGKAVYLDHGNGLVTMYFHLNDIKVEKGDEVKAGDTVGLIGSTGRSTGPHLHVGARWLNQRINPNLLYSKNPDEFPSL